MFPTFPISAMGEYDDSGYDDTHDERRFRHREFSHGKLGIASFVLGCLTILWEVGMMLMIGLMMMAADGGEPEEWMTQLIGFGFLASVPVAIVGIVLGGVAVTLPRQKKLFGFLGIAANIAVLIGVCGLLAIGLAAGG
jgi:hypothetical protein